MLEKKKDRHTMFAESRFDFQHPYGTSQATETPFPEKLPLFSQLIIQQAPIGAYTCKQADAQT